MSNPFNLVDQPWIPCVSADGAHAEFSLHDALVKSHTLRELAGETPLVTAALYRLLLAILHRVIAPGEETDTWNELWAAGRLPADRMDAYLARWHHRFDLFDPARPFFQWAHPDAKPKSVISLMHELASGNNPTLFDHHSEDEGVTLRPAEAARVLVTVQSFGFGGLSPVPGERFTDGPATRGITFLVQGDTLFETLLLNLIPYPVSDILGTKRDLDAPAWEWDDPFTPLSRVPRGYLDYLTWQSRRVLLLPEEQDGETVVRMARIGPGARMQGSPRDPLKHYRKGHGPDQAWLTLRFQEDRALWRDSGALLAYAPRGKESDTVPPYALGTWLPTLIDDGVGGLQGRHTRRLLALGMANDQAKVEFFRREQLPLPLAYLRDKSLADYLHQALSLAEASGRALTWALSSLASWLLFEDEWDRVRRDEAKRKETQSLVQSWGAERHYWAALDLPFYALIEDVPRDAQPARAAWARAVRRAARRALDGAVAGLGEDAASLKAAVKARGQLGGGLRKAFEGWPVTNHEEVPHA